MARQDSPRTYNVRNGMGAVLLLGDDEIWSPEGSVIRAELPTGNNRGNNAGQRGLSALLEEAVALDSNLSMGWRELDMAYGGRYPSGSLPLRERRRRGSQRFTSARYAS